MFAPEDVRFMQLLRKDSRCETNTSKVKKIAPPSFYDEDMIKFRNKFR